MKANELHPCDGCRGPLLTPGIGNFYTVRTSTVLPDSRAIQQLQGLNMFFGGRAPALAEIFAPDPHIAKALGEVDPELYIHALVCFNCYISKPLGEIQEGVNARLKAAPSGDQVAHVQDPLHLPRQAR